jgi:hypothetical protein
MPTGWASGIGTGGAGTNPWIAYTKAAGNWFTDSTAGDVAYRNTSGKLLFGNTSGNAAMAISSGNVGIGTTSPSYPLDAKSVGTDVARFTGSSGNCIVVAGTGWSCTSDERMKQNINTLSGSLDKIMNLRGVSYNWRSGDTSTTQLGFIAQEVEAVIPELVRTDSSGYKSVLYAQVTPYLVEAVKELNLKLESITSTSTPHSLSLLSATKGAFDSLFAKKVTTQELCIGDETDSVCVTKDQLKTLLQNANVSASVQPPTPVATTTATTTTTTTTTTSTTTETTATTTPSETTSSGSTEQATSTEPVVSN